MTMELVPVNLASVLEDLHTVVDSTNMLGGRVLDFTDPFKYLSASALATLDTYPANSYLQDQCDRAWANLKGSLERLRITLNAGNVNVLDCRLGAREELVIVWETLEEFSDAVKPCFTPGRPDPLWRFTAKYGAGLRLADSVRVLESRIGARPALDAPSDKAHVLPSDDAWVPANILWRNRFTTIKQVSRFRKDHQDMFRNPSRNRLEIHAAKWAEYWAAQDKVDDDDALPADYEQGVAELRAQKRFGRH